MKKFTIAIVIVLFPVIAFFALPSHAGMNDKAAIAKSGGKYKGHWKNQTAFPGTGFFDTEDPDPEGMGMDVKIEAGIRVPRKPKNVRFELPDAIVDGPLVKMKVTKTIVRRGGKLVKHVGTGKSNQDLHFGPGALLSGKGNVTLKLRGGKYVASGKYSAKDSDPVMAGPSGDSPRKVKGSFGGKG